MKNIFILMTIFCILASCSMHDASVSDVPHDGRTADHSIAELPDDYFALQSNCMKEWNEIFAEWKNNGGGIKASIAEMRMQIAMDDRSRLARFVRATWSNQDAGDARNASDLGTWPITSRQFRALSEKIPLGTGISPECQAWFDAFLWDEIASNRDGNLVVHRFTETPGGMEWTSPDAQHWMRYWLLIRIR